MLVFCIRLIFLMRSLWIYLSLIDSKRETKSKVFNFPSFLFRIDWNENKPTFLFFFTWNRLLIFEFNCCLTYFKFFSFWYRSFIFGIDDHRSWIFTFDIKLVRSQISLTSERFLLTRWGSFSILKDTGVSFRIENLSYSLANKISIYQHAFFSNGNSRKEAFVQIWGNANSRRAVKSDSWPLHKQTTI